MWLRKKYICIDIDGLFRYIFVFEEIKLSLFLATKEIIFMVEVEDKAEMIENDLRLQSHDSSSDNHHVRNTISSLSVLFSSCETCLCETAGRQVARKLKDETLGFLHVSTPVSLISVDRTQMQINRSRN